MPSSAAFTRAWEICKVLVSKNKVSVRVRVLVRVIQCLERVEPNLSDAPEETDDPLAHIEGALS